MKVDFIVAGVQKSGTSALHRYLSLHESISMAKVKEVHFFDNESNFADTINYADYHSSFEEDARNKIVGEATPIYTYWYPAPRRIWNYNPAMRWIIVLRNPIERSYSHWNMERNRGADTLSFSQAIRAERKRCREALPQQHRVYSYIDRGFYSEQLRRVWHFFPKEQVLVIKFDDLRKDVVQTLAKVTDFLEIERFSEVEYLDTHSTPYISCLPKEDRLFLHEVFSHEIKTLESLLSWDCSDWLDAKDKSPFWKKVLGY